MASTPFFVYPQVYGWSLDGDSTEQKPVLDLAAHPFPANQTPATKPAKPRKSKAARKKDDPNHIPRPRNSFFIFRCEYTRRHAEQSKGTERSPTPEKTLSKRAGAEWKGMSQEQKQPYVEMAREEAERHAAAHPDYRYKPERTKPVRRRGPWHLTRREKVESLVQMRESSAVKLEDTHSEYESPADSPVSHTSSSPEPVGPITPVDHRFDHREHPGLAHRRSMSLPHFDLAHESGPYPYSHTYFIQPTSCSSSPGPGPQRTAKRARSASQRSYSPSVASIPPPDTAFDLEYDGVTIPYATLAPHASSMSLPELLSLPDLSIDDDWSSVHSTPQMSPATSLHELAQSEYFPMQSSQPSPTAPLFHRRQRSNTAPSAFLSPLSVLNSTLGSYGQGSSSTATSGSAVPALTVSPPDRSLAITPTRSMTMSAMSSLSGGSFFESYSASASASSSSLLVPEPEMDLDRTPRRSDFPNNVQDVYAQPRYPAPVTATAAMEYMTGVADTPLANGVGDAFAMESYTEGLSAFDIAPATYDMSPFDDIDFSDFLHTNPTEPQTPMFSS